MVDFSTAVRNAINGVECFILSNNPFVNGSAANYSPAERAVFNDRINQARAIRGCDPAEDTTPPPPPFTGGQCPIRYSVTTSGTAPTGIQGGTTCVGSQSISGTSNRWGPLGAPFRRAQRCTGGPGGEASTWSYTNFGPSTGPRLDAPVVTDLAITAYDLVITSATPIDGGPDDCGDPEPVYPPPTNINIDIDVTYSPDVGPDITVTIPFEFSPTFIDFNGDIRFPFNFNFGGFDFNGNFSLDPTIPITINLPGLGQGGGQGVSGEPPDQPGESVPPEPPERKIIGVVVTATTIQQGRVSSYSSPGLTDIYVPRLGSVKFAYNLGGATFFSSDIDVKDRRTFIECPFVGGADAVIASPQVGVDFSFLPIRGFPVATTGDLYLAG